MLLAFRGVRHAVFLPLPFEAFVNYVYNDSTQSKLVPALGYLDFALDLGRRVTTIGSYLGEAFY